MKPIIALQLLSLSTLATAKPSCPDRDVALYADVIKDSILAFGSSIFAYNVVNLSCKISGRVYDHVLKTDCRSLAWMAGGLTISGVSYYRNDVRNEEQWSL